MIFSMNIATSSLHLNGRYVQLTAAYPALNEWHHVAATYDGYFMRLYLDGVLVASKEAQGDITVNNNNLVMGLTHSSCY